MRINLVMKIINWLKKPYPLITDLIIKFLISFSFGVFIYLFLIIFQPFGIDKVIADKGFYVMGFGMITMFVMLFCFIVLPLLFHQIFDADKWVISKEILFILTVITLISLLNYLYNSYVGYGISQQHALHYFVLFTVAVGFFPVLILVFATEMFLNTRRKKTAAEISSLIEVERNIQKTNISPAIEIISESKNDNIKFSENELIFIKSEDNYCNVYYILDEVIRTQLLRITLKNIENQLVAYPDFIRSHRSFIVNKKKISKISGNARAYYVHFNNCDEIVPISRNYPKEQLL